MKLIDIIEMRDPFWLRHQMKHIKHGTWINDRINDKAQFEDYCQNHWKGEFIVEVSGRDCDGVQYSGQLMRGPLSYYEYQKAIDKEYEWADGPIYFRLVTSDEAKKIRPQSRDLSLEAFEDGHPHILYESNIY